LHRGLKPLGDLGAQSAEIHADSLATRFDVAQLPAELQPIARQLNELLGRLEQSFERERRFSADLAHELRTPLAELRTIAECAIKWPENRDLSVDEDTLAIARQMEQIVVHILALARGEQGQLAVKLEPLALAPIVKSIWERFAERAEARNLRVSLNLAPVEVMADAALLNSIVINLCENAVDYTTPGGDLSISLQVHGGTMALSVANTTVDLHAEDIAKLFDRFWRKDAARMGGTHLGLGLSLATNFARSMRWELSAELIKSDQIVFTLTGALHSARTTAALIAK
jgi:two-component system sensor histidine kinase QseC